MRNLTKLVLMMVAIIFLVSACGGEEIVRDVDIPEVIPDKPVEKPVTNDTVETPVDIPEKVIEEPVAIENGSEYAVTDSLNEPVFPVATPATEWKMFRRTPDNMGLVSADIKLPLGKEWNDGENPEYRQVSFGAPAANYIYGSPAVVKNRLFFGVKLGYVQTHKFNTGKYLWRLMEPVKGSITTSIAADDSKIYFGTAGGGVMFAYDQVSDVEMWKFQTGKNVSAPPGETDEKYKTPVIMSSPKVLDGKLYFGAFDGKMYCLNTSDGSKVWEYTTGSKIYSSPAIASGRLYFANFEGKVFCLSTKTGELIWEKSLPKAVIASPVVFGSRVWIGCKNAKMYCLKAFDGEILWSFQAPDSNYGIEACPAIDKNNCYFGDSSGHFTCLDRKTGEKVWQVKVTAGGTPVNSSPVITGDKIFVGSHNKSLYVLNKADGKTLDSFETQGSILASPVIIGNEVLAPSYDAYIYILRGKGEPAPE